MAKKYDCDLDADRIIESFRASDDPAAPLGGKAKQHGRPTQTHDTTESLTPDTRNVARKEKSVPTDSAEEYKATFIDNLKYRYPDERYPAISIHPSFCSRIRELESRSGTRRCNVSTYINNVLEKHFKDCEEQINEFLTRYRND